MTNSKNTLEGPEFSDIALGFWRLLQWRMTQEELLSYMEEAIELGVTTFDHADIYGDHQCEHAFGNALALRPSLRQKMQLVTKCGIKLLTPSDPHRKIKHYDLSRDHIIASAERSLVNLKTDHLDVLLLHRPAPFWDPAEIARAFEELRLSGKVLHFGVSNFTSAQFDTLQSFCSFPLITNQVEISPLALDEFENGGLDLCLERRIRPMAWSPFAGGELFNPTGARAKRVSMTLRDIAQELGSSSIDSIIVKWIMEHPARIIPILGTGKIDRLRSAAASENITLGLENWYRIYVSSIGKDVP